MNHPARIGWREPTDEEIQQLTADRPDDRCGNPDQDEDWFTVYRDPDGGGVIFGENQYLTPSAWTAPSDDDLTAAWQALTGRQLPPRAGTRPAPRGGDGR